MAVFSDGASGSIRRVVPQGFGAALSRRAGEMAGLGLSLAGLAMLVALAGYAPSDPSLNTAAGGLVRNPAGPPGAIFADAMLQGFGLAAAVPPLAMLAWAWRLVSHRGVGALPWRLAALLGLLPTLSAALAPLPAPGIAHLAAGLGGAGGTALWTLASGLSDAWLGASGPGLAWGGLALGAAGLGFLGFGLSLGEWRGAARTAASTARTASRATTRTALEAGGAAGGYVSDLLARLRARNPAGPASPVPASHGPDSAEPDEAPVTPREPLAEAMPASRVAPVARAKPRAPAVQQAELGLGGSWAYPPLSLLATPPTRSGTSSMTQEALEQNARLLETVLEDFGVRGQITQIRPGPVVTLYELEPAPGTKSSRVIGLADDIARSMAAISVRVATVPGRTVIGIEMPNTKRETVYLAELLRDESHARAQGRLNLALGKDIGGGPVVVDLARMPHLLIAGTTGSGKSVAINTMILSLLWRMTPDECRMIMIDPKMLELSVYDGIPHLLSPVVTEPGKAVVALKWAVKEMERRYRGMSQLGVRNISGYNARVKEARDKGEVITRRVQTGFDPDTAKPVFEDQPLALETLPFIVVVVDEMADLMLVAGKEIEAAVQRLAQMARAAGIHIIMATQRPSVDVITGTIKANFPTRVSFQVTSKIDSRTILGEQGAEQLLGQGDMLYMAGGGRISRVHGPFVSDSEVEAVVAHLREQGQPDYLDDVTEDADENAPFDMMPGLTGGNTDGEKALYDQAVAIVIRDGKASTSYIQRQLQLGYNKAARLIEQMEKDGVITQANHVGKREILARRGE
jgi:S-DNA-T family DNA segregation ATPase FtsK/SpoIIIE